VIFDRFLASKQEWNAEISELEVVRDPSGVVVQASSNSEDALALLDGNPESKWKSAGPKGTHWIMLTLPPSTQMIEAVEMFVSKVR
jgi:hypothetical protein